MAAERHRVLIVDDNHLFVESLADAFDNSEIIASGCSEPRTVLEWKRREDFDYDLILLDMRLSTKGDPLHASTLLPHLMTYAPSAKVIVFSQANITVEECVRCIELGALTVVPKGSNVHELALVTKVYQAIGDQDRTREQLLKVLWERVQEAPDAAARQHLEMLVINLFSSMPTFRVVDAHLNTVAGPMDVLVENVNEHEFWKILHSHQMVVACGGRRRRPALREFAQLEALVGTRGEIARVGIFVTLGTFAPEFRRRQGEARRAGTVYIYGLDHTHLRHLVDSDFDEREAYLREVFSSQ